MIYYNLSYNLTTNASQPPEDSWSWQSRRRLWPGRNFSVSMAWECDHRPRRLHLVHLQHGRSSKIFQNGLQRNRNCRTKLTKNRKISQLIYPNPTSILSIELYISARNVEKKLGKKDPKSSKGLPWPAHWAGCVWCFSMTSCSRSGGEKPAQELFDQPEKLAWNMARHDTTNLPSSQWEFQDPKMEVLYHIRPYFGGKSPYISLIHGRYLQFRFLKWPLIKSKTIENIRKW